LFNIFITSQTDIHFWFHLFLSYFTAVTPCLRTFADVLEALSPFSAAFVPKDPALHGN